MNPTKEEILHVEVSIQELQAEIANAEALTRLENNEDFKNLISQGYFVNHASYLADHLGNSGMQAVESQEAIMAQLKAIGIFKNYLRVTHLKANMAKDAIAGEREALQAMETSNE